MGTGDMDYPPPPRSEAAMNHRLMFDAAAAAAAAAGPSGRRPAALSIDVDSMIVVNRENRFFLPQKGGGVPRGIFDAGGGGRPQDVEVRQWNTERSNGTHSVEDSGSAEDDDDDEDDDVDDGEIDGMISPENGVLKYRNNSSGSAHSSSEKMRSGKANSQEDHSSFGSSRGGLEKDGNKSCAVEEGEQQQQQQQQVRAVRYSNAITLGAPEMHYARILQGADVTPLAQKVSGHESSFAGHSGRRDVPASVDFGESLRMHLSDPITGTLMDDAMILRCGHSFSSAGMDQVVKQKACPVCGHSVTEDSIRPNLALRSAVHAFRREEGLHPSRLTKRRRDRFEHSFLLEKCKFDDSFPADTSRAKGVQFPFSVSDRVIIKGNKRTPQRFVGRVAVVTAQCLNGWYVVKTLDNAESVKLQYRSLDKAPDDLPLEIVLSTTVHSNRL